MNDGAWFAVIFVIAAIFGLRGSIRATRRYLGVRRLIEWRESWVLLLLAGICWTISLAAGFYGFLAVRSLLGYERIVGIAPISALLAALILFLPTVIDYVEARVERVDWQ